MRLRRLRLPVVVGSDEARRPSTPKAKLPGKSEIIFDGVDALFQLGTNNERCLDPKNRIALQKFIALEEQMGDEGAIARRADHEMNVGGTEWMPPHRGQDRKSTRLNSSHQIISYAVFCLKKKKQ